MARPRKNSRAKTTGNRAVVYLRVSKEDSATKHGLEPQLEACRAYLVRQSYCEILVVQDDGVSGAVPAKQRPALAKAFRLCRADKADVIVAYHQDRFARKMGVFDEIRDLALAAGVRLETADGRVLTHKDDFLNGDVLSLVSAIERRRIAERFYLARRHRGAKDGRGSGCVPWGYVQELDGTIVVDDAAAAMIRQLFAWRSRGLSYRATAEALNAAGSHTPHGGRWSPSSIQGIERHRALYETGVREWDGVTAAERWPIILPSA